jgi:hypothetical protein
MCAHLKARKGQAWAAFWKLKNTWHAKHIELKHTTHRQKNERGRIQPVAQTALVNTVGQRQLGYLGHVFRIADKEESAKKFAT